MHLLCVALRDVTGNAVNDPESVYQLIWKDKLLVSLILKNIEIYITIIDFQWCIL